MKLLLTTILLLVCSIPMSQADELGNQAPAESAQYEKATLAGGCFWCMQAPLDQVEGVVSTTVGYTGGFKNDPTYNEVSAGYTGHCEAIEIVFDPAKVSFSEILDVFWRNIDPTQEDGQFADIGNQYRTEIFFHNVEQKQIAEESKERYNVSGKYKDPIVTAISPAVDFYPAEEYHQKYYKKHPFQYKAYKFGSGRTPYINKMWGKEKK